MPFPPYERAVEALGDGDLGDVLAAEVELLTWMAGILTDEPSNNDPDDENNSVPAWISDTELREQLGIEAERLRQAAGRLTALRTRIAAHQAAERGHRAGEA